MNSPDYKDYIGDGVYVSFDGYHIWLTVERGDEGQARIALEPEVFHNLVQYRKRLQKMLAEKSGIMNDTP